MTSRRQERPRILSDASHEKLVDLIQLTRLWEYLDLAAAAIHIEHGVRRGWSGPTVAMLAGILVCGMITSAIGTRARRELRGRTTNEPA
jgi:hypothetical protein